MLKPLRNESVLELNIRAHYIAMEPTPVVEPIPAGEPTPEAEPNLAQFGNKVTVSSVNSDNSI